MSKLIVVILSLYVMAISAFVVPTNKLSSKVAFVPSSLFASEEMEGEDSMYWEGEYPPSKVLGPLMSKMPSQLLGPISGLLLGICVVSCYQSGQLQLVPGAVASGSWVKWYLVLGSFMGPLAWGTHVACWIQRKNGM
mmetsp:Transcript_11597/g.13298  ORF Transcript_11597/g.13298 Transcript_11597/m.13298 type:complete len:137 (-) Transcript_11597:316-726(-)